MWNDRRRVESRAQKNDKRGVKESGESCMRKQELVPIYQASCRVFIYLGVHTYRSAALERASLCLFLADCSVRFAVDKGVLLSAVTRKMTTYKGMKEWAFIGWSRCTSGSSEAEANCRQIHTNEVVKHRYLESMAGASDQNQSRLKTNFVSRATHAV